MADDSKVDTILEPYEAVLLLLVGFGSVSVILAMLYNFIRRRVFGDIDNLDRDFDAGGNVSFSLTAVTVAVQMMWPADLLFGATVTWKAGIAGNFWYSTSIILCIMLFPAISITFKTRAPGAKTFLQLVYARYGKAAHVLYCIFAIFIQVVNIAVIIVAGHTVFKSLVHDISDELIFIIFTVLFGSYSFIGGLGSTFYVSYANGVITFVIVCYYIIYLFFQADESNQPFGTYSDVYDRIINLTGPVGNEERNFLTFWSMDAIVWAVEGIFLGLATTFCDQANWQSRVAAKPSEGVFGFVAATFIWFAIPPTIGTTTGLLYLAYTEGHNNTLALSDDDAYGGLILPYIAQVALGRGGGIMILISYTMLMMGTGSGEVMGVSAIIVYDIFQTYVYPYRKDHIPGRCLLCNKRTRDELSDDPTHDYNVEAYVNDTKTSTEDNNKYVSLKVTSSVEVIKYTNPTFTSVEEVTKYTNPTVTSAEEVTFDEMDSVYCACTPASECVDCQKDLEKEKADRAKSSFCMLTYICPIHGDYRLYQESLLRVKNWVVIWVTLGVIPLGFILMWAGIDMYWLYSTGCALTVHAFPGVMMSIIWVKTSGIGLIAGALAGLAAGITTILSFASTFEGGLSDFLANTADPKTNATGAAVSFSVCLIVTTITSLFTHKIKTPEDAKAEWQKLRDIDNPVSPWSEIYKDDFPEINGSRRPTCKELTTHFRSAKRWAIITCILCILLFVVIIPGAMAALHVLTSEEFKAYLMTLEIWTFLVALFVIFLVPVEEIHKIIRQLRLNVKQKLGLP